MESMARAERAALCNTALETGPDAPTMCEGWDVRDLVVHLLVRERNLPAAAGIAVPALARFTERASRLLREHDFTALVERVRTGPPLWNPTRVGAVDRLANTAEYFVHHEDIRRAQPGWEPRELTDRQQGALFGSVSMMARGVAGGTGVAVTLRTPDGREHRAGRRPGPAVAIVGDPGELLLFALGRESVARVAFDGDDAAITRLREAHRGI